MNDLVLLLPQTERGIFTPPVKYELSDEYIKLWIKDTPRALKKAAGIIGENKAVISKAAINMGVFKGNVYKYENCTSEELFLLTEKCVRAFVQKNGIKLPFYEIFIYAIPDVAVNLIQKLRNYARIFTVIYNGEFDSGVFDGLYFKYGIITRHLCKMKSSERENSLVITTDSTDYIPPKMRSPEICLSDKTTRQDAVMVKKTALKTVENPFIKEWGFTPSVFMFDLLNIKIDDNTEVDIINKADEIFMLDITSF